jgi:hypothetical protein
MNAEQPAAAGPPEVGSGLPDENSKVRDPDLPGSNEPGSNEPGSNGPEANGADGRDAQGSEADLDESDTGESDTDESNSSELALNEPADFAEFAALRSFYWSVLFALHAVAAVIVWWVLPGGFPASHPRFWVNSVLPWLVVATASAGVWAIHYRQAARVAVLTTVVAAFWAAIVVGGWGMFPTTASRHLMQGLLILLAAGGARLGLAPARIRGRPAQVGAAAAGVVVGLFVVFSQRGPAPSTHPNRDRMANFGFDRNVNRKDDFQRGSRVYISPIEASAKFTAGAATVAVKPLLHFESRSPDRCWTNLAAEKDREPFALREVGRSWEKTVARMRYFNPAQIFSVDTSEPDSCLVEGVTQLDEPVYSHLNSFAEVDIEGHGEVSLTFSPCGPEAIMVPMGDYPVGRPIRFAYLGADGIFRVVEASSAEKGPFTVLAEGPLGRDEPLVIGIRVDGRRAARLTFLDFARQASTELSPTAGWGVPQNAIEMRRMGESSLSPVRLWLTLAGTSVGRGFDSVGHAAGTYRNRVRIEIDEEE